MEGLESTLQVNHFARRNRHLKSFSISTIVRMYFRSVLSFVALPFNNFFKKSFFLTFGKVWFLLKNLFSEILPSSPQKKLFFQAFTVGLGAIIATSFTATGAFTSASMAYSTDYIAAYYLPGEILVADEDGYLVKINPQTDESNRIGLTDYAMHTVENGESLSVISEKYGVKVETIMWENKIANANTIRVGQAILVPPVDGVGYKVASGDTLDKIAKKYSISSEAIVAQNGLESNVITKEQRLFLPGAKPISPPAIVVNNARNPAISRSSGRSASSADASSATPSVGRIFIFPTSGKITNGYHAGHYALDIADRSMPPIWAAGSGTVVKASSGTWGGGYGNHVIVDHGNGVKTLYGHMDSLNVYEGQVVNQGDVIGIMGNTGRVYGVTGIHLHWEVIDNGVKQYPANYY